MSEVTALPTAPKPLSLIRLFISCNVRSIVGVGGRHSADIFDDRKTPRCISLCLASRLQQKKKKNINLKV